MADEALDSRRHRQPPGASVLKAKLDLDPGRRRSRAEVEAGFAHGGNMAATGS
jgi:hypothetical protein